MGQHLRVIWRDFPCTKSPEQRGITLAYEPDSIESILMSFSIDLTRSGSFLNAASPVRINEKEFKIQDIPQDTSFLSKVEKNDIPITDLLKIDAKGTKNADNMIAVNYVDKRRQKQKSMPAGTLTLYFTVIQHEVVREVTKSVTGPKTKFCMYDGKNIPDDSVFCCYCGQEQPRGGASPKECRNCQALLPPVAVYCKECGNEQPKLSESQPEGSSTEMSLSESQPEGSSTEMSLSESQPEGSSTEMS
jgi:hypothetical protein